ncbi:MAG: uroporphyrinogen decarboxylase [Alphaproteobacteria bacterium]|nr:uroporphyrinogen decarboxylase [Alphaproteobacteria bacterium]
MEGKPLLDLLSNRTASRMPLWFMRQAGRYLPEYRELRKRADGFLDLCLTPDLATEITLQPIRRFGLDAAILFADILLVPYALGRKPSFEEGKKPEILPIRSEKDLEKLRWNIGLLEPVFETLSRLEGELPDAVTRIGFAGGLWTVACYMIDGGSAEGFPAATAAEEKNPAFVARLFSLLHDATLEYLGRQIEAGAEVIQIFDSWAGLLRGNAFQRLVVEPTRELVAALKKEYPNVPVIGFPRGALPEDYKAFVEQTGVDALGIDQNISLSFARSALQPVKPLQGNLDPRLLVSGGRDMQKAVDAIIATFGPRHIFNLGHGILPQTPPENVARLVEQVRTWAG